MVDFEPPKVKQKGRAIKKPETRPFKRGDGKKKEKKRREGNIKEQ